MKKFSFRLQPVLKLREQQEEQKKRVVGVLQNEIAEQQRQALAMAQVVKEQGQILKDHFSRGNVDVNWISYYQGYVSNMQRKIAEKINNVAHVQKKLIKARVELAEAAKQTKIIEKLKEKRKQRYDKQLQRQEIFGQDELANNMFYRRGSSIAFE
jgi:flagellar FliJ protein